MPATFFVTTANDSTLCESLQMILADGHTIENHSRTHPHFEQIPVVQRQDELTQVEAAVYGRCGIAEGTMTQFRPPFLEFSGRLVKEVNQRGYTVSDTNVDSSDWKGTDLGTTWRTVLREFDRLPVNASAVVLHHNWASKPEGTMGILALYQQHFAARSFSFVSTKTCFDACVEDHDCVTPNTAEYQY